ncbi:MAG: class II aldolase/adducin family protein, partial [Nitrospirae bacterium]|nr:class II aldolase/adducin family protein [Nitrospirota bacterium]
MKTLWSDEEARGKDDLALRVYTSRLIGAEPNLVMWGGGNTSVKTKETDHRGRPVDVLRVKGSGSDLKTIEPKHFSPVRMDDVLALEPRNAMSDEEMVAYLRAAMTDPEAARPSIETLLHAFLPLKFTDHTHADAILSLTNQARGEAVVREVLGDGVICVPFIQPGFHLSKVTLEAYRKNPDARAIVLMKHGLITFGGTAKKSYDRTIEYVTRAEEFIARGLKTRNPFTPAGVPALPPDERRAIAAAIAPVLRGAVSKLKRSILLYDDSPEVLEFVNSKELHALSQIGPATPDHVIRTKGLPLALRVSSVRNTAALKTEIAAQVEQLLLKQPEVLKVSSEVGFEPGGTYFTGYSMGAVNAAGMMITLADSSERKRDIWQVIDGVRDEALRTIPGIRRFAIKEMGADVMASSAAPIQVIFHGPDLEKLSEAGEQARRLAEEIPG